MLGYIGHCLARLALAVAGIVTIAFFLTRAIPGDPAEYMLGDFATKEAIAQVRAQMGLDQPVLTQYRLFVTHALTGNLGTSIVTKTPAIDEVMASLPPSAALALLGLLVAIVLGVPLGIWSAVRQGTWIDTAVMIGALAGISFPAFWLGIAGILLFAYWLPVFPALGTTASTSWWTQMHHLALPAIVLGLSIAAYIARLARSAMLEVLSQDYIRVARAMGVPERRIILVLALRNALIPILAVIGVSFAWSFGNAILIEVVFSRPGLGSMLMKAIQGRDYQLVQAGVLVVAAAVVLMNALLDLLYGFIDPRVRTT